MFRPLTKNQLYTHSWNMCGFGTSQLLSPMWCFSGLGPLSDTAFAPAYTSRLLWQHCPHLLVFAPMKYIVKDQEVVLQHWPGKGAWTYHLVIPNSRDLLGTWGHIKVSGTIDDYAVQERNLAPRKNEDKMLSQCPHSPAPRQVSLRLSSRHLILGGSQPVERRGRRAGLPGRCQRAGAVSRPQR